MTKPKAFADFPLLILVLSEVERICPEFIEGIR